MSLALALVVLLSMIWNINAPISAAGVQQGTPGQLLIEHSWNSDTEADRPSEIRLTLYQSADGITRDPENDPKVDDIMLSTPDWSVLADIPAVEHSYYVELDTPLDGYTTENTEISKASGGLVWEDPTTENPLGSACYFSVTSFGDVSVTSADVESGMAVGGNFTSTSPTHYSIGMPAAQVPHTSWGFGSYGYQVGNPIAPHDPRFLVKGNITVNPKGLIAYGGSIVASENSNISVNDTGNFGSYKYTGSNSSFLYDSSTPKSNFNFVAADHAANYASLRQPDNKIAKFFTDAESSLKSLNQHYADFIPSGATGEVFENDPLLGNVFVLPGVKKSGGNVTTICGVSAYTDETTITKETVLYR